MKAAGLSTMALPMSCTVLSLGDFGEQDLGKKR